MGTFRHGYPGLGALAGRPGWRWLLAALLATALTAGAAPAGAAGSRWLTLSTPRVRIHFRPGYEVAAIEAARAAEATLDAMADRLGHAPRDPVHVTLMDVTDLSNGFTDVSYYNRIVIYPAFPVGLGYSTGLSPRMRDWLELVVTHEVVHAVHLDMAEGPARGMRQIFGHVPRFATPNLFQPVAFIEGLATFEETQLVEGGRGEDPLYDMFLRAAVLESALPDIDRALGLYDLGHFQPGAHVYLYGYTWFALVADRYGEQGVRDLQKRFAAVSGLTMPGEVVRRVLGQELESLWREMRQELERHYQDEIATIRAAGATEPTLVEAAARSGAWVAVSPRLSPDGRLLAYAASGPYVEDVRLVDLETGRDRQLALGLVTAPGGLDWSRDGRYVVYAAADEVEGRVYSDLYQVEVATGRVQRLTHGRRAYAPATGPGGLVAYAARDGLTTRVVVRDPTGAERVLWEPPQGWQLLSLAWSPQGDRLALAVWKPGGGSDLLVLWLSSSPSPHDPAAGPGVAVSRVQPVTDDPFVDDRPSWSPDGRHLLFHSDRDGVYNLYAIDPASGETWRLTNVVTGAFDPVMAPDGQSVFFSWFWAHGYRIARLDASALRWEAVQRPRAPAPDGAWTPEPKDAEAPAVDSLPASWRIGPYTPFESLCPTYWEPLIGERWPGPFLGAATGGLDAVGERAYALAGAVGLATGAPLLYAGYARLLGDGRGPVLTLETSVTPEVHASSPTGAQPGDPYDEVAAVAADLSWQRGGFGGGWQASVGAVRSWIRGASSGEPWAQSARETRLLAGWLGYRQGGEHRWASVRQWSLQGETLLERAGPVDPLAASALVAGWQYARQWIDGTSFQARLAAGVGGGQLVLPGGGESGPFAVRAYESGIFSADAVAVGLSAERAWRLADFRFGLADAPTFFDDLGLALFTEAAAGWDRADPGRPLSAHPALEPSPGSPALGAGAEVRLRLSLDYGRVGLVVRLGLAQGFAPVPETRWYLRLEAR